MTLCIDFCVSGSVDLAPWGPLDGSDSGTVWVLALVRGMNVPESQAFDEESLVAGRATEPGYQGPHQPFQLVLGA